MRQSTNNYTKATKVDYSKPEGKKSWLWFQNLMLTVLMTKRKTSCTNYSHTIMKVPFLLPKLEKIGIMYDTHITVISILYITTSIATCCRH